MATFRGTPKAELSDVDLRLLVDGPWAVGMTLWSPEADHGRLRGLWRQHEAAVRAEAARRGLPAPWFEDRDQFVRDLER
jgi:hypothetical protein